MILDLKTKVDKLGIEDRVSRITKRSLKSEAKLQGLKMILSMIDLTTLEGMDTIQSVKQLCYKATHNHNELPDLPNVAAVCVYPTMVKTASNALKDFDVKVASVATDFPSGSSSLKIKIQETKEA
jgi:deoxyribose-phosphate aldolase